MQMLDRRFGMVAIEHEFITKAELQEALKMQIEGNIDAGIHKPIGNILRDLGYMDKEQVKKILLSLNPE